MLKIIVYIINSERRAPASETFQVSIRIMQSLEREEIKWEIK